MQEQLVVLSYLGGNVQPIDGSYLYSLGGSIRPLKNVDHKTSRSDAWITLYIAKGELERFLNESVYSYSVKTSRTAANALLQTLNQILAEGEAPEQGAAEVGALAAYQLSTALTAFESVMAAEFGMIPIFLVTPKKGYDLNTLIYSGQTIFPDDLTIKVPAAIADIQSGAKCLAYEAWTAAAFHFLRALESVLRRYWESVMPGKSHPGNRTIGDYLYALRRSRKGAPKLKAALKDLKDLDRNPVLHPEYSLANIEEIDALMGKIKNAMSQMLLKIPPTT
jgi:hypothetical protein